MIRNNNDIGIVAGLFGDSGQKNQLCTVFNTETSRLIRYAKVMRDDDGSLPRYVEIPEWGDDVGPLQMFKANLVDLTADEKDYLDKATRQIDGALNETQDAFGYNGLIGTFCILAKIAFKRVTGVGGGRTPFPDPMPQRQP